MKKNIKKFIFGTIIGIVNGTFGAGGGIIAVPLLRKLGAKDSEAHASAVAVILPIATLSATVYLMTGRYAITDALPYIIPGIIGSVVGAMLLYKVTPRFIHILFGGLIIYCGIRMVL